MTSTEPPPPDPDPPVERAPVAVVFAGGDPLSDDDHRQLRDAIGLASDGDPRATRTLTVIAADSGLHVAQAGGWRPGTVIGDLDSVDPARLRRAEAEGARLERHPAAKSATDLERALDAAVASGAERIIVAGGHGGRLDHFLANVALLGSDRYAAVAMSARLGPAWIHIVRQRACWTAERGDLVTLLALGGPVHGVTTDGLLYPLVDATLEPGSTRGVSNEHVVRAAAVTVTGGALAVVLPGEAGTHVLTGVTAPPLGAATPAFPAGAVDSDRRGDAGDAGDLGDPARSS